MKKIILITITLFVISCSKIDKIVAQFDDYICVIKHTYTNSDNESATDYECFSEESESSCNDLGAIQNYSVEKYDKDESCTEYCEDVQNCSVME